MPLISPKALVNLLKALTCTHNEEENADGKKVFKENKGIFRLIRKVSFNPMNAFRIIDLFFVILPLEKTHEKIKKTFQEKDEFLGVLKNKILAQIEIFLKKNYLLPFFLKEDNVTSQGNLAFSNFYVIFLKNFKKTNK